MRAWTSQDKPGLKKAACPGKVCPWLLKTCTAELWEPLQHPLTRMQVGFCVVDGTITGWFCIISRLMLKSCGTNGASNCVNWVAGTGWGWNVDGKLKWSKYVSVHKYCCSLSSVFFLLVKSEPCVQYWHQTRAHSWKCHTLLHYVH